MRGYGCSVLSRLSKWLGNKYFWFNYPNVCVLCCYFCSIFVLFVVIDVFNWVGCFVRSFLVLGFCWI